MGLAVMTELPLVVINVQRGGPSTGLPTKTEQADLLQGLFGRNGESPMIVLAPLAPADCFDMAYEAVRLATAFMTPVLLLSDGYLANGAEPWRIPAADELPEISVTYQPTVSSFAPYTRDARGVRPWVRVGTPGLTHCIGGLEKAVETGSVNMQPDNHETMVGLRAAKIEAVAKHIPPLGVEGAQEGRLLVLGWGSTFGAVHMAVRCWNEQSSCQVGAAFLRYLNPFPRNLGAVLSRFERVLIPELNSGQLALLVRGHFGGTVRELHKIQGRPFTVSELVEAIGRELDGGMP